MTRRLLFLALAAGWLLTQSLGSLEAQPDFPPDDAGSALAGGELRGCGFRTRYVLQFLIGHQSRRLSPGRQWRDGSLNFILELKTVSRSVGKLRRSGCSG